MRPKQFILLVFATLFMLGGISAVGAYAPESPDDVPDPVMMGTEATDFIETEIDHLYQAMESELGPLAADGGNLADDILGQLPPTCWDRLSRQFLRT